MEAREAWDEEDEKTVLEWMRDGGVVQQAAKKASGRIVKECKYEHPVLGRMSYSKAIAAAMAACKGQGTLKFAAA